MNDCFALRGNLIWSRAPRELAFVPNGYAVCEKGLCVGVFATLPEKYAGIRVEDCGDGLILPGLCDLHLHAPQYPNVGLGYDLELLEWLDKLAFREEARYADLAYAERAYDLFARDLLHSATTRACVFATTHTDATLLLMQKLEKTGLLTYVGRVNMDRNGPERLIEKSAAYAHNETETWIRRSLGEFTLTRPILTPRFAPSCTDALLDALGTLRRRYRLSVQSHLSETRAEVAWVRELFPAQPDYASVYDAFGLFGGETPTVMAHCIYLTEKEKEQIAQRGVFIAHCPASNANISSGIAPVREFLDRGLRVGLGSDVSGGHTLNLLREAALAVSVSKLLWRLQDGVRGPVTVDEALFLATRGGGAFFGKVGAFEPGYAFDAVVFDDVRLETARPLALRERLEKLLYLSDEREVRRKYVEGRRVL